MRRKSDDDNDVYSVTKTMVPFCRCQVEAADDDYAGFACYSNDNVTVMIMLQ